MTIDTMKTTTFDETGFEQWKEAAIQSLKGKPFDSLITTTMEGIDLQPLYTREHFLVGTQAVCIAKEKAGWIVAQQTYATDGQQFVNELKNAIDRGNEAIVYDGTKQLDWDDASLHELAKLMVDHPIFVTNIVQDNPFLKAFSFVPESNRSAVKGAISASDWTIPEGFQSVRTYVADTWEAHHNGADAITELALALAQAVQQLEKQENFSDFAAGFFARFAVDTHFFMEIAKFRAFRILWQVLGTAYGESETPYVPIIATTSLRSYSKLDPYVNLLRAGNGAFSAVLGGVDVLTVHPHDILTGPTESSVRFARNIQLVVKEETHADKVTDPSGGSYFIETLTAELVDKAWALFLEIEAEGGYEVFLQTDCLAARLEKRRNEVATGKKSLIGTNVYAELTETNLANWDGVDVEGRLAEPFEELRALFAKEQPKTVLLTFGELKDFKPRADFVGGFLATGGIHSEWSPAFRDVQAAIEWLAHEKPTYVIVCATPAMTESIMEQLLSECPKKVFVDVAGKYEPALTQRWLDAGLNGFLYSGQNKIEKLLDIHNKWKGAVLVEKA